jgi:hypothetical protein
VSTGGSRPWPGSEDAGGDWLAETADELAHLGFVLRDGSHAGTHPGPRLLIAFRDRPTLEHFDPEEATYWEVHAGRGRLQRLARDTPAEPRRPFAWGRIRIADRIPVTNQFLSFGGQLLVDAPDERVLLAAFTSPAPIVRWAGHSQGMDLLADEIGSFFGRLMVPIDYQPDAESRVDTAEPEVLYAAFLMHAERRLRPGSALRIEDPGMAAMVDHESRRLTRQAPAAWSEGEALLGWLQLG